VIPREGQVGDRRERVHHGDEIVGPQLIPDEPLERIAHGHRVGASHVVVIEEEHEDAHVFAVGDEFLVSAIADLAWRRITRTRVSVHPYERELLNRLRLAVFEHFEVGLAQIGDRLLLAVVNDDVHPDEVDAAAEHGSLRLIRGGGLFLRGCRFGRLSGWPGRLLLLGPRLRDDKAEQRHREQAPRAEAGAGHEAQSVCR
jgi:hypothetical protein